MAVSGNNGKTLHIACMDGDIAAVQVHVALQGNVKDTYIVLNIFRRCDAHTTDDPFVLSFTTSGYLLRAPTVHLAESVTLREQSLNILRA